MRNNHFLFLIFNALNAHIKLKLLLVAELNGEVKFFGPSSHAHGPNTLKASDAHVLHLLVYMAEHAPKAL